MLYKAALIRSFGRGSDQPFRAAIIRLVCLGLGAFGLGLLFCWGVWEAPLSELNHQYAVFFGGMIATQITIVLSLYASAGFIGSANDTFARLLLSWPLGRTQRNILLLLPSLVLTGLALLLIGSALSVLLIKLGLSVLFLPVCLGLGVAGAFGLLHGTSANPLIRLATICAATWSEYKIVQLLMEDRHATLAIAASIAILAVLIWLCISSVLSIENRTARPVRGKAVRTVGFPPLLWHVKKLLRSRTPTSTLIVSIGLSAALAVICKRQGINDASAVGLFGAILTGSFASDLRALARRDRPAEITALRGTARFITAQTGLAFLCSAVIALPLLMAIGTNQPVILFAQVSLGTTIGLLAGSLIVPEPRDVMGQFLALLLVLGVLAGLPQLPILQTLSVTAQTTATITLGLAALTAATAIEYKRNNYTWKNNRL